MKSSNVIVVVIGVVLFTMAQQRSFADDAPFRDKIILFGAQREGDDTQTIMAMTPEGKGLVELWRPAELSRIAAGRVSNDGRRLAFMLHSPGAAKHELWQLDSDLKATKIAEDAVIAAWSPDDKHVACFRVTGARTYENFILDLETKHEESLKLPDSDVVNDWSSDGMWLTVMASHRDNRFEHPKNGSYPLRRIYRIDVDGEHETPVSAAAMAIVEKRGKRLDEHPIEEFHDDIWSRISHDGSQVTYHQRTHSGEAVRHTTIIQSFDVGIAAAVIIYEDHSEHFNGYKATNFAVWSPDGKQVVSPLAADEKIEKEGHSTNRVICELLFASAENGFTHKLRMNDLGVQFVQGIDWR